MLREGAQNAARAIDECNINHVLCNVGETSILGPEWVDTATKTHRDVFSLQAVCQRSEYKRTRSVEHISAKLAFVWTQVTGAILNHELA